jgi:hypothetical protein
MKRIWSHKTPLISTRRNHDRIGGVFALTSHIKVFLLPFPIGREKKEGKGEQLSMCSDAKG